VPRALWSSSDLPQSGRCGRPRPRRPPFARAWSGLDCAGKICLQNPQEIQRIFQFLAEIHLSIQFIYLVFSFPTYICGLWISGFLDGDDRSGGQLVGLGCWRPTGGNWVILFFRGCASLLPETPAWPPLLCLVVAVSPTCPPPRQPQPAGGDAGICGKGIDGEYGQRRGRRDKNQPPVQRIGM
jgi:hypothetical protein